MESFLTVQEAADFLGINRQNIYNWINSGNLPFKLYQHDGVYKFSLQDLEAHKNESEKVGLYNLHRDKKRKAANAASKWIRDTLNVLDSSCDDEIVISINIKSAGVDLSREISFKP